MIDKVIKALNDVQDADFGNIAVLNNPDYAPVQISMNNFRKIEKIPSSKSVVFIDGGSSELISSPNLSIQLLRTAAVKFRNNKRESAEAEEHFLVARAIAANNKISYEAELFNGVKNESFLFNPFDKSIKDGGHAAKISKIGEIIRRFLELRKAVEYSVKSDFVVLDGSLEANYPGESALLEQLQNSRAAICALSKTSALLTNNGFPFSSALQKIAPKHAFYYYPVAEAKDESRARTLFVKLNEKSRHIFKFGIFGNDFDEAISLLAENSKDILFAGYPYGLILADKAARISNKEAERLRMMMIAKSGKSFEKIMDFMSQTDAHSILDRI